MAIDEYQNKIPTNLPIKVNQIYHLFFFSLWPIITRRCAMSEIYRNREFPGKLLNHSTRRIRQIQRYSGGV